MGFRFELTCKFFQEVGERYFRNDKSNNIVGSDPIDKVAKVSLRVQHVVLLVPHSP